MNCSNCTTCEVSEARGCGTSSVFNWLYSVPKNKIDANIVEVEFKKGRKEYYKNQNNIGIKKGDAIMVEGEKNGYNIGTISLSGPLVELQLKRKKITDHIKKTILGFPNQEKIDKWKKTINKESEILKEAQEIIDNYFEEFPKVKEYMDWLIEQAREKEYVETIMGRRRYLKNINARNAYFGDNFKFN